MKVFFCFVMMNLLTMAFAQDPSGYLKTFDSRIYSLKSKGVKDFAVDIESTKLTKQINDHQLFGKIDELLFRIYWTAQPERLAIEVIGLPEGFKELKEELKASILPTLDNLLPQTLEQRFIGYKFSQSAKPREILAQDKSGIATIPSYSLKFDEQDRLVEVIGNKPVGSLSIKPVYEKESFADGKWVLKEQQSISIENGQRMVLKKDFDYGKLQGIGILTEIEVETEYTAYAQKAKPVKVLESIMFKNYKINEGIAFKYFLGEAKNSTPQPAQ